MVFSNYLLNEDEVDDSPMLINDSTIVRYKWDEKTKKLEGQYNQSKISKAQILSYNLTNNDLLFINSHYSLLKKALNDKNKKDLVLKYLSNVKNYGNNVER
jgi:hypothetical protein